MKRTWHKPVDDPRNPVMKPETPLEKGGWDGRNATAVPHFGGVWYDGTDNLYKCFYCAGWSDHAESRMPITCVGRSSGEIEVWQDSPTSLSFLWPVTIDAVAMRNGLSFSMTVTPDCLGGGFAWTNSCCSISSSGWTFTYSCNDACHCAGCCALGCYTYESFSLPASGGSCGGSAEGVPDIGGTNEPPVSASVSVSFSQAALFYEEAYTNEPGVVVSRRVSTNATCSCSVSGGQYGGVFNLSCGGFDRLLHVAGDTLPNGTVEVSAGETRTWLAVYAPLEHSLSENDVSAVVTFNEYMTGETHSSTAQLTVVELKLEPQATKEGCENRHLVGVREIVNCYAHPHVGQWGETGGGELVFRLGVHNYTCPLVSDGSMLYYSCDGSRYDFDLTIVEPSAIVGVPQFAYNFGVATNHAGDLFLIVSKLFMAVIPIKKFRSCFFQQTLANNHPMKVSNHNILCQSFPNHRLLQWLMLPNSYLRCLEFQLALMHCGVPRDQYPDSNPYIRKTHHYSSQNHTRSTEQPFSGSY